MSYLHLMTGLLTEWAAATATNGTKRPTIFGRFWSSDETDLHYNASKQCFNVCVMQELDFEGAGNPIFWCM